MPAIYSVILAGFCLLAPVAVPVAGPCDDFEQALAEAQAAQQQRKYRESVELATKAIELMPENARGYLVRSAAHRAIGQWKQAVDDLSKVIELKPQAATYLQRSQVYADANEHEKAIADIDRALELDPRVRGAYRLRGREEFKRGRIDQSIADFDQFIKLEPNHEIDLWERGLSRYYAGQFQLAQRSFEDYHKFGPGDIENGLWRMISQAEVDGLAKAQRDLFTYQPKTRPPFPALYDLYSGKSQPDEIVPHAADGARDESDARTRRFYAHLYVGLWHHVNKESEKARDHMQKAVALESNDYMWYVARQHMKLFKDQKGSATFRSPIDR